MFLKTLQCVNSNRTLVLNASVYTIIQVKLDKIIDMLAKKFLLDGCDRITTQYTDMMKRKNNLTEWANDLHYHIGSFRESLGDFKKQNVKSYLTHVYENHCTSSLEPLYSAFG